MIAQKISHLGAILFYLKKSVSYLEPTVTISGASWFDWRDKDSRMASKIISIAASPYVESKTWGNTIEVKYLNKYTLRSPRAR